MFVPSYFRKGLCFGLACFANMPVESELERGARMKSVGILSPSYTLLYRYMHFLENQVRYVSLGMELAAPHLGKVTLPRWRAVLDVWELEWNAEL